MSITAADIAKLRKITGAGMMDCKTALTETNGNFDEAIDFLRKRGQKISAKRADRDAFEGVIIAKTNADANKGVVIELNCETDFVAKNQDFIDFATLIADTAINTFPIDLNELKEKETTKGTINQLLDEQIAKIGEKIEISNFIKIEGALVVPYIHMGNKIGVLVSLNMKGDHIQNAGKDIAMQIAAMNPIAVNKDKVSPEVIQKEIEIAKEQIKAEGKPEDMAEKIAIGKLNKFFKENTLIEQAYVKDSSKTIKDFLKETDPKLEVIDFVRVAIGQ